MRRHPLRASGLVAAACAFAACSEFSSGNDTSAAPDAGGDAGGGGDDDAAAASDAAIDAAPELPCRNASCGVEIATGEAEANEVLVDEARVYWTIDNDTGGVRAREHGGSPAYTVASGVRPRSLVRSSEFLHFASGSNIRHIERYAVDGGTSQTAVAAANPVTSVARAGGKLFATSTVLVQGCGLSGNTCSNQAFDFQHDVGPGARALVVDRPGTRVWLASDTALWKTEVASPNWLEWWSLANVRAIVADETAVFIARAGVGGITKLGRDDAKSASPVVLAPNAPPAWALAEDGAFVFYTAIDEGVVMKVAKDGSSMKVIASEVPRPKGVAVRLDKVYVALGDGRVVALPH